MPVVPPQSHSGEGDQLIPVGTASPATPQDAAVFSSCAPSASGPRDGREVLPYCYFRQSSFETPAPYSRCASPLAVVTDALWSLLPAPGSPCPAAPPPSVSWWLRHPHGGSSQHRPYLLRLCFLLVNSQAQGSKNSARMALAFISCTELQT